MRPATIIGHRLMVMPMNDIRNNAIALRNGSASRRPPSACQHSGCATKVATIDLEALGSSRTTP
jgi:hypothetical protein